MYPGPEAMKDDSVYPEYPGSGRKRNQPNDISHIQLGAKFDRLYIVLISNYMWIANMLYH